MILAIILAIGLLAMFIKAVEYHNKMIQYRNHLKDIINHCEIESTWSYDLTEVYDLCPHHLKKKHSKK